MRANTTKISSPPHGGADRNLVHRADDGTIMRRPLTGARIETASTSLPRALSTVAPSRGRGSKLGLHPRPRRAAAQRRPLTGARIETYPRHPHRQGRACRPLTGARIETCSRTCPGTPSSSPPHGGADRNHVVKSHKMADFQSPPHGGADRNFAVLDEVLNAGRRPLTGARIETPIPQAPAMSVRVAPSRGRGSKHDVAQGFFSAIGSPPHGGADRNYAPLLRIKPIYRRPLTGARIETTVGQRYAWPNWSPPHGGADRNNGNAAR